MFNYPFWVTALRLVKILYNYCFGTSVLFSGTEIGEGFSKSEG